MKQHLAAKSALILAFACLATSLPAQAAQCTLASVAGNFGYTTQGFVVAPNGALLPAAAVGRISFNSHGNVSGTQTRVVAGTTLDETFSGTFNVNPDCTGKFTVQVLPDTRTSTVDLVWTDNTNSAVAVFTTPGVTLSATAHRISVRASE